MNSKVINFLKSTNNKEDRLLATIIASIDYELSGLSGTCKGFNRGDIFESYFTGVKVSRDGKHGTSQGDTIINGERYEIKYLTKKTKASAQSKGTICEYTLVAFNNGDEIIIRKIATSKLITRFDNYRKKYVIAYQDNINNGIEFKRVR